ncbi:MAG: HepT-like ribonuclease domain-containing protein [Candidatus Eremiobacterota bacterium]
MKRLLIILGEAAGCVSEKYRTEHPEIPWRRIQRARNALEHACGRATAEEVWKTAREFAVPLSIQRGGLVTAPPPDDKDRCL